MKSFKTNPKQQHHDKNTTPCLRVHRHYQWVGQCSTCQIPSDSLALWLKADDGVVTNGNVTQWNDNSGNGRDAVAMLGTYPTLVNNELCGQPVIRFNGNNGIPQSSRHSLKKEVPCLL
jgi:hypothetical protein